MSHINLEDEIIAAIERCCVTKHDKEEALRYFEGITVNEMIEESQGD